MVVLVCGWVGLEFRDARFKALLYQILLKFEILILWNG
jgi:hypothetical protein